MIEVTSCDEMIDNMQTKVSRLMELTGLKKVRVCFETASWNSSDGKLKTYYHLHFQHDDLPDLNIGVGDSNFNNLLYKVKEQITTEITAALYNQNKNVCQ